MTVKLLSSKRAFVSPLWSSQLNRHSCENSLIFSGYHNAIYSKNIFTKIVIIIIVMVTLYRTFIILHAVHKHTVYNMQVIYLKKLILVWRRQECARTN